MTTTTTTDAAIEALLGLSMDLTGLVRAQSDLIRQLIAQQASAGCDRADGTARPDAAEEASSAPAREPAPEAPRTPTITLLPHEVRQAERALRLREQGGA